MITASIIIPNYNGIDLLKKHLPAVVSACQNHEIIVVDDASTDDSVSFIKNTYPQIKVISLQKNLRFASACNRGVKEALGTVIVLLNNDVSPEKDFLPPLLNHFNDPQVFAVGSKEIKEENHHQEVSGRNQEFFHKGLLMHQKDPQQIAGTTAWVFGGSGAFNRRYWQELNGLDPLFKPAYEEDRDICYRAWKMGYICLYEPESVIYHHHETTNKKVFGDSKIKIASYKNHLLIVWKNITSPSLILKHLLWLPYHLVVTTLKSRGLFLLGFFYAVSQLPQLLRNHKTNKYILSDETVLKYIQ